MKLAWQNRRGLWATALAGLALPPLLCLLAGLWWIRPRPLRAATARPQAAVRAPNPLPPDDTTRLLTALALDTFPHATSLTWWFDAPPGPWPTTWPATVTWLGTLHIVTPSGETTYTWLDAPATDTALQAAFTTLLRAGWWEPAWARALVALLPDFAGTEAESASLRLLCGPQGRLTEFTWARPTGTDRLRITVRVEAPRDEAPPPPCSWAAASAWVRFLLPNPRAWVRPPQPDLSPPPGVRAAPRYGPPLPPPGPAIQPPTTWALLPLRGAAEALRPPTLLETYTHRLQRQGWHAVATRATATAARGTWRYRSLWGHAWRLDLAWMADTPEQTALWMWLRPWGASPVPETAWWTPGDTRPQVTVHGRPTARQALALVPAWWPQGWDVDTVAVYPAETASAPPFPWPPQAHPVAALQADETPVRSILNETWVAWAPATTADDLTRAWEPVLRAAGWQPDPWAPPPPQGLLAPNLRPPGPPLAQAWCHPVRGIVLAVRAWSTSQGAFLMVERPPAGLAERCQAEPDPGLLPPRPPKHLPILTLPPDLPRAAGGTWGDPARLVEVLWVRTSHLSCLEAYLARQLEAQGWQARTRGQALELAWGTWYRAGAPVVQVYLGHLEDSWTWIALVTSPEP